MRCGAGLVGARVRRAQEHTGPCGGGHVRRADDDDPGWVVLADGAGRRGAAEGVWRGVGCVRREGAVQTSTLDLLIIVDRRVWNPVP